MFLNPEIIHPNTLELLKSLMQFPALNNFVLVGGTSLAMQIGHRNSVDLDLFSPDGFDTSQLTDDLKDAFGFKLEILHRNTLIGSIENVKVDIITHNYPYVESPLFLEGIRFASIMDIAAMKLNAIAHNGTRYKDFVDIYYLLGWLTMGQMADVYTAKYPNSNMFIPLRALTYFDDIDFEVDQPILFENLSIQIISKRLTEAVVKTNKLYQKFIFCK
ncbi:MAG: nucleotidyl transferase AbiEii/AbiGii toxin family protein [Chitinophagaceae bacterium]|nr:nucleotidyl transferase AbiEii/AbiGii toxin family protein [Chitinophagaceae bacterium]